MLEIIFSFCLALALSGFLVPIVIRIAKEQDLVDIPNGRKSHNAITPTFGGIAIFTSFVITVLLFCPIESFPVVRYILTAIIIVFLVGAIDDLDPISPWAKLTGQLLAVMSLVFLADIRISSLYGLFGIGELSYFASGFLSTLLYLFLINSFNLIDGINGLSSSVTIFIATVLGCWFYMADFMLYSILAWSIAGSTLAFFRYNITPAKIFMGDTGSLVLGTICTILIIQFLEINYLLDGKPYAFSSGISFALTLVILPVFDTLRVFTCRIINGRSPFEPDKNHIHHLLLDTGMTHMQATWTLLTVNILFVVFSVHMQEIKPLVFIVAVLFVAWLLSMLLTFSVYIKRRKVARS